MLTLDNLLQSGAHVPKALRKDLTFAGPAARGRCTAAQAAILQELLVANGAAIAIDGDWGPATQEALSTFIATRVRTDPIEHWRAAGIYDDHLHEYLIQPFLRAFAKISGTSFPALLVAYARQQVVERPVEIGGPNAGPWVRAYMGWDGSAALWCAGFVQTLMRQAAASLGMSKPPISGDQYCDTFADQAKAKGLLHAGADGAAPGDVFLVRGSRGGSTYLHTGLVVGAAVNGVIETIEGNSNAGGSANGFCALKRLRGTRGLDLIKFSKV